jgi:hypothetical protein
MKLDLTSILADKVALWDALTRWERAELGRALRGLGWTYGEIQEVIQVPKGTLSYWCREVPLTAEQKAAIVERTGSRRGVPRDTQRKRREEIENIRAAAADAVPELLNDPLWITGTVLYWGEGAKTQSMLAMVNTDPRVLRTFIDWVRYFHDPAARFVLSLHLHQDNDEQAAKTHWVDTLGLSDPEFYKTYRKAPGTGHRNNRHLHGVCRVLMRRSADAWHRTMAWIDALHQAIDPGASTS